MKVLLISPNRLKPPVIPLGIIYIATYLRQKGIDVELLDLCFVEEVERHIREVTEDFRPDLIGMGIRNIDNVICTQSEYFAPGIKKLVDQIRTISNVPIVLGGAGYSIFPQEIIKLLGVEYGINGEGEKSMYFLCEALQGRFDFSDIPGLVYYGCDGEIISNLICNLHTEELCSVPLPDFSLTDIERYYKDGGVCSIQTKRGCALDCVYCTYPIVEGKSFRLRQASDVVREMKAMMERFNMSYFYFVDSIFNVPFNHAEAVCDEIIKSKLNIRWFGYVSPAGFTSEGLKKMILSGADGIWLSTDTCSEAMLKNMGKGYGIDTIVNAINLCKDAGVKYNLVLVLGGPGETEKTLNETFDFLERYDPNIAVVMYGLRVYPHTELYDIALREGVVRDGDDLLEPVFYLSSQVKDTIVNIIKKRTNGHENWYPTPDTWNRKEKIKNVLMEKKVLEYYRSGVRGPFWAVVDKLKNGMNGGVDYEKKSYINPTAI